MHTHHRQLALLIAGIAALGLAACAGDLPTETPMQDAGRDFVVGLDRGSITFDQGPPQPDTTPGADGVLPTPDTGTPQQDTGGSTGVGTPCTTTCDNGLLCLAGTCRNPCNQPPADPCDAISDCAATERCLPTSQTGVWGCLPATTLGAACDQNTYCPNRSVCASVNNNPHQCLPVCTVVGEACGTGGNCLDGGNGCLICSKP